MCVLILYYYVSSYYYMCVLLLLHVSSYYYICVLMLYVRVLKLLKLLYTAAGALWARDSCVKACVCGGGGGSRFGGGVAWGSWPNRAPKKITKKYMDGDRRNRCPHTAMCLLTTVVCPHATIYASSYYCMCVLILLYMFLHTTVYVSSYFCYVSSYYCICVLILLYVSSYYCICILLLLYMNPTHLYMCPHNFMCFILLYVSSFRYICVCMIYKCVISLRQH
jgi:hypothetical protein